MKKKAILFLLSLVIFWPVKAPAGADPAALLRSANGYYLKGDYLAAQDCYRQLLDSGIKSGKVYYNLGNTQFRMGKIGEAIRNYLFARQFMPRDADLATNLAYARHEVKDRIEPSSSGMVREIFFWYDRLSVPEMIQIFLICNLLCWSGLAIRLFSRRPAANLLILFSLGLGIAMGGTAALRITLAYLSQPAVVIVPQVAVQSGTDPASTTLFELHDGAEVSVERVRGSWSQISLASGKKGWVKKENIGLAML